MNKNYKVKAPGEIFKTKFGENKAFVTIIDNYGSKTHITFDDGCYVIYRKNENDICNIITHIDYHLFDVLKNLPNPSKTLEWWFFDCNVAYPGHIII